MAGSEDTELRDLVVEALERNGALARVRALLRANIFLAFESEREPRRHNPALERLAACPEGSLALAVVAEFLDFCKLDNTAFVYRAESRQGRAYRYEGRRHLPEHIAKEYAVKQEPVLVTILRQAISTCRRKRQSASPGKDARKEDDNCTYIVHDESASTRSHSDNSSDDKSKLLLRLPLDHSDTDTSSDSMRDKTSSEYIPNQNIRLDPDSDDDSKHLHYVLSPKSYVEEERSDRSARNPYQPYVSMQNATYAVDDQMNLVNSSDSTSYLDLKPQSLPKISNGNTKPEERTPAVFSGSLVDISDNVEVLSLHSGNKSLELEKQSSADSHPQSVVSVLSNNVSTVQELSQKSEVQASVRTLDKSDARSFNYSDEFSPVQESSFSASKALDKDASPRSYSTDSDSIKEDISINGSERRRSSDSPNRRQGSSHSSVSLSDIAELIENSASSQSSHSRRSVPPHRSVIMRNSSVDEVTHRLSNLFRKEGEKRMSSAKNSSEEISDSPVQSLSNISIEVHSD